METRFDVFTKLFAGEGSRRDMLKRFGGLIASTSLVSVAASCDSEPTGPTPPGKPLYGTQPPGRCRNVGTICRENSECCSGFCDASTGRCACAGGSNFCNSTGQCVTCTPPLVFNASTCKCECLAGSGGICGGTSSIQPEFCCPPLSSCCKSTSGFPDACCGFIPQIGQSFPVCCGGAVGGAFCCPANYTCCRGQFDEAGCCPPGTVCQNFVCVPA